MSRWSLDGGLVAMLEIDDDGDETGEAYMCGAVEAASAAVLLEAAELEAMLRGARGGREAKLNDVLDEVDGGLKCTAR